MQSQSPTPPSGWHVFLSRDFRFSVAYPDEYAIVPEGSTRDDGRAFRVRFQDKQLLQTGFGTLEPPRFTVDVFAATSETALRSWLASSNRLPAGAVVTPVAQAGAREALRVQLSIQLAPNDFYYYAAGEYIYSLIPLGEFGSQMLASFRLL